MTTSAPTTSTVSSRTTDQFALNKLIAKLESAQSGEFDTKAKSELYANLKILSDFITIIAPEISQTALQTKKLDIYDLKTRIDTAIAQEEALLSLDELIEKTRQLRSVIDLSKPQPQTASSFGSGAGAGSAYSGAAASAFGSQYHASTAGSYAYPYSTYSFGAASAASAGSPLPGASIGFGSQSSSAAAVSYTSLYSQSAYSSGAGTASAAGSTASASTFSTTTYRPFLPEAIRCLKKGIELLRDPKGPFGEAFTKEFRDYDGAKKSLTSLPFLSRLSLLTWMLGNDSIEQLPEFVLDSGAAKAASDVIEAVRKEFHSIKDTNFLAELLLKGDEVSTNDDNFMLALQFNSWASAARLDLSIELLQDTFKYDAFPKKVESSEFEEAMKAEKFDIAIKIALEAPKEARKLLLAKIPAEARYKAAQACIAKSDYSNAFDLLEEVPFKGTPTSEQQKLLYDLGERIVKEGAKGKNLKVLPKVISLITDPAKSAALSRMYFAQKSAAVIETHDSLAGLAKTMEDCTHAFIKGLSTLKPDEQVIMIGHVISKVWAFTQYKDQLASMVKSLKGLDDSVEEAPAESKKAEPKAESKSA